MIRRMLLIVAVAGVVTSAAAQSRGERSTLAVLNQRIPEVRMVEQPMETVLEWLGEFSNVTFIVRWRTLEDAGLLRDTPISMQVRNVRLSQVLWLVFSQAGGADIELAYRAQGDLIVISTQDDLGREMVTKVYDVADLLVSPVNTARPDFQSSSNQGIGQQGQGGGGQSIFGDSEQNENEDEDRESREATMERLIEIIKSTVEPDSWDDAGGEGTITSFKNLLIVRNSLLAHQQLGGYLREGEVLGP